MTSTTKPDISTADVRTRLAAHFQSSEPSSHGQKWDELWIENFLPWDRGGPNPALVDLLAEKKELLGISKGAEGKHGKKKALVPGCGKGYDVLLLSACGYDAYGLEISSGALEAAKKNEKEVVGDGPDDVYKTREGVKKGPITWLAGDFFKGEYFKDVKGEPKFDIIYDYTVSSSLSDPRAKSDGPHSSSVLSLLR